MQDMSDFVLLAKGAVGYTHMSDREFGERLHKERKYPTSRISDARYGKASDQLAIDIGELLEKKGLVSDAAEVLLVARLQRETDDRARTVLKRFLGKVLAAVPATAAKLAVALAACLISLAPNEAFARAFGGVEPFRRRLIRGGLTP